MTEVSERSRVVSGGAPFLEIEGLTKMFGGVRAVDDVDLTLGADEMRCVIGPNGCGKTTLFNLITGYLPPTSGTIRFEGRDLPGRALHEIARAGIVRKFQVPSIFAGLTVEENLRTALAAPHAAPVADEAARLLSRVRLDRHRHQLAGTLSHGQKQWLELALVLAAGPRLILLDEPSAGMTREEKAETVRLIHSIRAETAISALVIEHDMDFVEALECPVVVMMLGRMVASGTFNEVRADPVVREAYLGTMRG
jgi:ABC-type branched-subunit amino acid transport system ATPase component